MNIGQNIISNILNESKDDLWKSQMSNKSDDELKAYLNKLYKRLLHYNETNSNIKSDDFYDLLNKIDYLEDITKVKPKLGRRLR